jgi:hypothetical protein
MTTPAATALYLAKHLVEWEGKGYEIYNPHNKPLEELPVIYGFNNGGQSGWLRAVAIAEDGNVLGRHTCSHEGYMRADLGIIKGSRPGRHEESYRVHYPDGYRMDFVPFEHEGLQLAVKRYDELREAAEKAGVAA